MECNNYNLHRSSLSCSKVIDIQERRKLIINGITLTFFNTMKRVLLVWSPDESLKPDLVVSVLTRYDKKAEVYNNWNHRSLLPQEKFWVGSVVVYSFENLPVIGAEDLRKELNSVKTILLKDYLDILIEAEIRQPDFEDRGTWLQITASRSLSEDQVYMFELDLHQFGNVLDACFYNDLDESGLVCSVKYEFTSQAIAAKTMLNGKCFPEVGCLTVKIFETEKENEITSFVNNVVLGNASIQSKKTVEDIFIYH